MATDNITPIRAASGGGHAPPPEKPRRRGRYKRVDALVLEESPGEDGYSIYDAIAGLRAVCEVLDSELFEARGARDGEMFVRLVMAARVLSTLIHNREADSGPQCGYRVLKEVSRSA